MQRPASLNDPSLQGGISRCQGTWLLRLVPMGLGYDIGQRAGYPCQTAKPSEVRGDPVDETLHPSLSPVGSIRSPGTADVVGVSARARSGRSVYIEIGPCLGRLKATVHGPIFIGQCHSNRYVALLCPLTLYTWRQQKAGSMFSASAALQLACHFGWVKCHQKSHRGDIVCHALRNSLRSLLWNSLRFPGSLPDAAF